MWTVIADGGYVRYMRRGRSYLLVTHSHEDHFHPWILGWRRMPSGMTFPPQKTVVGPRFSAALEFLQIPRFPELKEDYTLVPLSPCQTFEEGELYFETCFALHVSSSGRIEPSRF